MKIVSFLRKTALLVLLYQAAYAQSPHIKSAEIEKAFYNKFLGYSPSVIGLNENNVYIKAFEADKPYIHERDKKTLEIKKRIPIIKTSDNYYNKGEKIEYVSSFIFKDKICLVKNCTSVKNIDKYYLELYSINDVGEKPTIFNAFEISDLSAISTTYKTFSEISYINNTILLGCIFTKKGSTEVNLTYKTYNINNASLVSSGKVVLPIKVESSSSFLVDLIKDLVYGDDNNIHLLNNVVDDSKAKQKENLYIYSIINTEAGELNYFAMKADDKILFRPTIKVEKNEAKVFGFYQEKPDKAKDNYKDINGYYYATINTKSAKIESLIFNAFTKEDIATLSKGEEQSHASKNNLEGIGIGWVIEKIISINNETFLIGSKTKYHIVKGAETFDKTNIAILKINKEGGISNITNIKRSFRHTYRNPKDVETFVINNKLLLVYSDNEMSSSSYIVYDCVSNEFTKEAFNYGLGGLYNDGFGGLLYYTKVAREKDGLFFIHQYKAQNSLSSLRFE